MNSRDISKYDYGRCMGLTVSKTGTGQRSDGSALAEVCAKAYRPVIQNVGLSLHISTYSLYNVMLAPFDAQPGNLTR